MILPAADTAAAMVMPCRLGSDQPQATAAAVGTVALVPASSAGGGGDHRCRRASFAIWADSSVPATNGVMRSGSSSPSFPTAGTGAASLLPPRAPPANGNGGSSASPARVKPASEAADPGKGGAAFRRSSGDDFFARGLVIQPSSKLLGLMEIHDRGSAAA